MSAKNTIIVVVIIAVLGAGAYYFLKNNHAQPQVYQTSEKYSLQSLSKTYKGTSPCADCPGIETELTLNSDGTYSESLVYIDSNTEPFVTKGTWKLENGTLPPGTQYVAITPDEQGASVDRYLVLNDKELKHLGDGSDPSSPYNNYTLTSE